MNKLELIDELKKKSNITKPEAKEIVQFIFDLMGNSLTSGDHVEIRRFGSLRVKKYKSYTGRNPKTGEKIIIKSRKLPAFKCGNELRKRVDY
jgi:integration host factor subunit beta